MRRPFPYTMKDTLRQMTCGVVPRNQATSQPAEKAPTVGPIEPHPGLVSNPVDTLATAEQQFFDSQLALGNQMIESGLVAQTAAEQLALDLARQFQPVLGDPLQNQPEQEPQVQPFGPHPYDPMKPGGGM